MTMKKPKSAKERIILALDVDTIEEAEALVCELKDYTGYFKIGLQLYSACGFEAVKMVKKHNAKVFFDSKFHDIPNTVARASVNLMKNGVDFFNLHLSGGSKMLSTTVKLARETAKRLKMPTPTIMGISLLSSFGQKTLTEELNVKINIEEYVLHLAKVAKECCIDGVLASASEARLIRRELGDDFIIMCHAIRPTWSVVNDQIRVTTPTDAVRAGVDFMIVGRPVTSSEDKIGAIKMIIDEIEQACVSTVMEY